MHDDNWLLCLALLSNVVGLGWLALAMDVHWKQTGAAEAISSRTAFVLRALGAAALTLSLVLCLRVDHASIAALVWLMAVAAAALIVTFTLTWQPRWLALLILGTGKKA